MSGVVILLVVAGVLVGLGHAYWLLVRVLGEIMSKSYRAEHLGEPWFPWWLQILIAIAVVFRSVWRFMTWPFRKKK